MNVAQVLARMVYAPILWVVLLAVAQQASLDLCVTLISMNVWGRLA